MPFRPEREKAGFIKITFRDDVGFLIAARNEWDDLTEALKAGKEEWHEVTNLYGDVEFIRLSDVVIVGEASPAGIAQYDEEEEQRAAYRKAHGDD